MTNPLAVAQIRWFTAEEGGRQFGPPPGPEYWSTAYFAEVELSGLFSIGLRRLGDTMLGQVELRMLVPDGQADIAERFKHGAQLIITEGPRPVAVCDVVSVQELDKHTCANWQHGSRVF